MAPVNGWIKMRKCLAEDPRVQRIADHLGLSTHAVLGKLFVLWSWADTYAKEEFVPGLGAAWIDTYTQQPGFAEQLAFEGWIEQGTGGVRFIDFGKHNWKPAKERAMAAKRMDDRRQKEFGFRCAASATESALPIPKPSSRGRNSPTTPSCTETDETPVIRAPALLTFPCDGPTKAWDLTQDVVDALAAAYPSLDILAEARKALAWIEADPARRKTARGMRRFLTGWMARSQERGHGRADRPAVAPAESLEARVKRLFAEGGEVLP